jgi:thiol-disulfide isomerase/thioredoxin
MKKMTFFRLLVAAALCGMFGMLAIAQAQVVEGKAAPEISATDASGKTVKLSDFKGKVVLLDVWASWCAPCLKELPKLNELAGKMSGKDVVILAVNIDEQKTNAERFLQKLGTIKLQVLYDQKQNAPKAMKLDAMPSSIIVDKAGMVRHVHRGFESGDEAKMEEIIAGLLK